MMPITKTAFLITLIQILSTIILSKNVFATQNSEHKHPPVEYAVYSGSFDPPTIAHGEIIKEVLLQKNIQRIYVVVNKYNEKNFKSSVTQRVKMLELMLEEIRDKVIIIAQDSPNKRTDYMTLKKILNSPILLVTGEDSYLRRLKLPDNQRVTFDAVVIIPRNDGILTPNNLEKNASILKIDYNFLKVSSTSARECLKYRNCKESYLHPKVESYIIENGLYANDENASNKKIRFEKAFYEFLGRTLRDVDLPKFEQAASDEAWSDQFMNFYLDNKLYRLSCFKTYEEINH